MLCKKAIVAAALLTLTAFAIQAAEEAEEETPLVKPGAKVETLATQFRFTEGPASDKAGNVYFTDIPNTRIMKWSTDGVLSVFMEESGGANGLYFDEDQQLLACQARDRRMASINPETKKVAVLTDSYEGKKYNSPNDLWLDPKGGIYFTDPRYGNRDGMEMGEHVYYISPDRKKVTRVIDDMVRPNGLIGTPNGVLLYVADQGANKTYRYFINSDGTLAGKTVFAEQGSDGITMDQNNNIYLTGGAVNIYNPMGEKIKDIEIPQRPSNVCFGGPEETTLFVTARTGFYSIDMALTGCRYHIAACCAPAE